MTKTEDYRAMLRSLAEWEPYLLAQSGYPLEHAGESEKEPAGQNGCEVGWHVRTLTR